MAPSGGQICNKCKRYYVVAKFNPSHGVNFWVRCASGNVYLCVLSFFVCFVFSILTWTHVPCCSQPVSHSSIILKLVLLYLVFLFVFSSVFICVFWIFICVFCIFNSHMDSRALLQSTRVSHSLVSFTNHIFHF